MKILFIVSSMDAGGVTSVTDTLARQMKRKGHDINILSLSPCSNNAPPEQGGIHMTGLPNRFKGIGFFLLAFLQLFKYFIRNRQINYIIIASPYPAMAGLAALKLSFHKARTLVNFHTTISRYAAAEPLVKKLILFLGRPLLRLADHCANVSQEAARDAECYLKLPSVKVLYNPLASYDMPQDEEAPHPWLADPTVIPVIACGRLTRVKDYPLMLQSFQYLLGLEGRYRLLILGDGEMEQQLKQLAYELGVSVFADFLGKVPNPREYMYFSRFLWLTSSYEGFPMVMVEALSTGIPCVAVDCLSGPREILQDSAYGLLLTTRDPRDMARAIHDFAAQPAHERSYYQQRAAAFDPEEIAEAYLALSQ